MAYGSCIESQVAMAQAALDAAARRNGHTPPAPQPDSVTGVSPCANAVSVPNPFVGGNEGGSNG